MPRSMPDAPTILGAAVKYLEEELLPTLAGYHRFKTRVTINALAIVKREADLRGAQAGAELERLGALLGHGGELEALSAELAALIRSGAVRVDDPAMRAHVRQGLADALAINNPKWFDR
ncbi:MAG TPA: DUF6285 domain-containing protein [Candidatus Binataceae bacterium]|nr:DUF6285 domain-containing protein [Candidatus Binataceae bacterium]